MRRPRTEPWSSANFRVPVEKEVPAKETPPGQNWKNSERDRSIGMNVSERSIKITEMSIRKITSGLVNKVSSGIAMTEAQLKSFEKVR